MSRIAYVDGRFVPQRAARVAMEDRGYQFADGVYEVIALYENRLIDAPAHIRRLARSLEALGIAAPMKPEALRLVIDEMLRRNRRANGLIYMQVTRGAATRNHIPKPVLRPVLSLSLNPAKYPSGAERTRGVAVITQPDARWARCDVKSIALLPNVLARMAAQREGAREAWQVGADGYITEGALSNAYLVSDDTIWTHPEGERILGGITREVVLALARREGLKLREQAFRREDIPRAQEAFLTSASSFVLPVTRIDGAPVGDGTPGPVARRLMAAYDAHIRQQPMRRP